jgi:hypothetical protein
MLRKRENREKKRERKKDSLESDRKIKRRV